MTEGSAVNIAKTNVGGDLTKGIRQRIIKVCCFPLFLEANTHIRIIYEAITAPDIKFVDFNWLKSAFTDVQVFHVHWPDAVVMGRSGLKAILKLILFCFSVTVFRWRKIPIIYSVHNIGAHEQRFPRIEKMLWTFFLPRVDVFVHMNSQSPDALAAKFPGLCHGRHMVIPLPHYRGEVGDLPRKLDARTQLGIAAGKFVFLCFGLVRPYKGLEVLIPAFRAIEDSSVCLIIAGSVEDPAYGETIQTLGRGDPRIHYHLHFLPDAELKKFIAASDVVVLAHNKLNNSGVALHALSCDRPIVAPRTGAIIDLLEHPGPEWVTTFTGQIETEALLRAQAATRSRLEGDRPDLTVNEPSVIAEQMYSMYSSLAAE